MSFHPTCGGGFVFADEAAQAFFHVYGTPGHGGGIADQSSHLHLSVD